LSFHSAQCKPMCTWILFTSCLTDMERSRANV
jgi:hypothetical protein